MPPKSLIECAFASQDRAVKKLLRELHADMAQHAHDREYRINLPEFLRSAWYRGWQAGRRMERSKHRDGKKR